MLSKEGKSCCQATVLHAQRGLEGGNELCLRHGENLTVQISGHTQIPSGLFKMSDEVSLGIILRHKNYLLANQTCTSILTHTHQKNALFFLNYENLEILLIFPLVPQTLIK